MIYLKKHPWDLFFFFTFLWPKSCLVRGDVFSVFTGSPWKKKDGIRRWKYEVKLNGTNVEFRSDFTLEYLGKYLILLLLLVMAETPLD